MSFQWFYLKLISVSRIWLTFVFQSLQMASAGFRRLQAWFASGLVQILFGFGSDASCILQVSVRVQSGSSGDSVKVPPKFNEVKSGLRELGFSQGSVRSQSGFSMGSISVQ